MIDEKEARRLLELAAKAAGKSFSKYGPSSDGRRARLDDLAYWQPYDDDGDALRLARCLLMSVNIKLCETVINWAAPVAEDCRERVFIDVSVPHYTLGIDAATRLAIVRAAAAIGERMLEGKP